tara:strand:+ start:143 stop:655 length:513 start_codon:yes stop_codon:yes gene_type:complete
MKKILYLFLSLSFIFTACKKEEGCTDAIATNFNADAEEDDNSCIYSVEGVWSPTSISGNSTQTVVVLGQTVESFDTTFTMTPEEANMEGPVEFTDNGQFITPEDTSTYVYSNNTITMTDDEGDVENFTCTVTKTTLEMTFTESEVTTEDYMGVEATVTENMEMTINATRQ